MVFSETGPWSPLSEEQVNRYRRDGFLLLPGVFSEDEVKVLVAEAEILYSTDGPSRTFEADGRTVRAVHGFHRDNVVFHSLSRDPRTLGTARRIVGDDVYIHQSKINAKRALDGAPWPWHQDFVFWQREDGMVEPKAVNIALFLDEATEFNGPLLLVPGSHRDGVIPPMRPAPKKGRETWESHLASDLEYTVGRSELARCSEERGIVSATGGKGTVLIFDSCIVHGSGANMSPEDRRMLLFTYNSVRNVPTTVTNRPDFLASRDTAPLTLEEEKG
ncbi:phytanoyl-CoA dioxygenase family protein [Nocardiopsis alba]|uniref:phytanoyl-CoA dioxygenase family protein n=1 Tax=Nocardiopsis alba TaxID=53437 RepID=UPI0033D2287C